MFPDSSRARVDSIIRSMEEIPNPPPHSDDLRCQKRLATFQNVGWVLLILFLVAAAFGLFGSGPYSSETGGGEKTWLKYERVVRRDAPTRLQVRFSRPPSEEPATVSLNQSYIDKFTIEKIIPEPTASLITSEGIRWTFDLDRGATNGTVHLDLEAKEIGRVHADLKVDDEVLQFRQLILP